MKVVHIGPGGVSGRGGIGRYIANLIDNQALFGQDIQFYVIDSYGLKGGFGRHAAFLRACLALLRLRLNGRADLLHIHMSHYGSALRKSLLLLLGKALGLRTVIHIHGSRFHLFCRDLPAPRRALFLFVLGRADRIVVIAGFWRDHLRRLGLPPGKIVLIHNGVPDPGFRRHEAAEDAGVRLLALGELGPRKGTPEIIAAFATPSLRQAGWRAALAGNGAVAHYRALIHQAGLADRVTLPGWADAETVRRLLDEADILLLPSRQEGLPLAILEALAAGAAVIATPVGGIPDAVIDGETGLLVPEGDAPALAAAILRLIRDGTLRRRLATAGRRRYETAFSMDILAGNLTRLYRDVAGESGT